LSIEKLRSPFDTSLRRLSGFGASVTGRTDEIDRKYLIFRSW